MPLIFTGPPTTRHPVSATSEKAIKDALAEHEQYLVWKAKQEQRIQ